jgi:hypothetical protein
MIAGLVTSAGATSAVGTVSGAGAFSLSLGSVSANGTFSGSGSVSGSTAAAGAAPATFGGVSATVTHTDRLVNLSTRGLVGDGEKALFAGFVITGDAPKSVLVRASGPTLASFGLAGAMENPVLSIVKGTTVLATNDDWSTSADSATIAGTAARVGAFVLNAGSKDAAIMMTLDPGVYSAQVNRASGTATGLTIVEVYDASANPGVETQKLVNISTRGEVRTGDNIMIGGFVVTGNVPKRVLIRGVGPTLGGYGVSAVLADPVLTLYQGSTFVATNDNWSESAASASEIAAAAVQVGAFPLTANSKDSVLLLTLAPGVYSAQISGAGGTTGIVLLEIYEVP